MKHLAIGIGMIIITSAAKASGLAALNLTIGAYAFGYKGLAGWILLVAGVGCIALWLGVQGGLVELKDRFDEGSQVTEVKGVKGEGKGNNG